MSTLKKPVNKVIPAEMSESTKLPFDWIVFDNALELARFTCQTIVDIAKQAVAERGVFHFVTAGGTTPLQVYKLLAEFEREDLDSTVDWSSWQIYIGDERCLPTDDPERNSLALEQAWLALSQIPKQNIHIMPAELGPVEAAKLYQAVVENIQFDVVLLGMGEDGHTASLFPGHSHEREKDRLVQTEFNSPKAPSERVTLSAACLGHSRFVFKLITGESKRNAVKQLLDGVELPISKVNGAESKTLISRDSLLI